MGEEFNEDHPIREEVAFPVDPSSGSPHNLRRHPAICTSLLSSSGASQLTCYAKVTQLSHPFTGE